MASKTNPNELTEGEKEAVKNIKMYSFMYLFVEDKSDYTIRAMLGIARVSESKILPDDKIATLKIMYEFHRKISDEKQNDYKSTTSEVTLMGVACMPSTTDDLVALNALELLVEQKGTTISKKELKKSLKWLESINMYESNKKKNTESSSSSST